jgi:bacteriorhodopsin
MNNDLFIINKPIYNLVDKGIREQTSNALNTTFMVTQVFLIAATIITFIGAIQTTDKTMRLVLGLECFISAVAGYYYSVFVNRFSGNKIKWSDLAQVRYNDWAITTPIMLLVLLLVLGFDISKTNHVAALFLVVLLDYCMLYFGYLGETGNMDKWSACLWGWIPFIIMFEIIRYVFLVPGSSNKKIALFWFFLILWSIYGTVYDCDDNTKNILFNILDAVAKGGIGIGLYAYFL